MRGVEICLDKVALAKTISNTSYSLYYVAVLLWLLQHTTYTLRVGMTVGLVIHKFSSPGTIN